MSKLVVTSTSPSLSQAVRFRQKHAVSSTDSSVCAIVVAYFPDGGFNDRIQKLLPQVTHLVIIDNTPEKDRTPSLSESHHKSTQIHVIENSVNRGISVALNQGLKHALEKGDKWILTLDQDTHCFPDMVKTLLEASESCEPTPMIVGGNYLDLRNGRPAFPTGSADGFLEQVTVITSGCLVNASFAATIGGFREDYFIDQVDHEFCLRTRSHGQKIIISRKPVMSHSVGDVGGVRLPLLGVMPNHPPLRKYYIARNTLVTLVDYWHREPEWCVRRLMRLLLGLLFMALLEKQRFSKICAFAGGISDALRRRMGVCARERIHRSS